jgi:glutathione S-transferase
MPEYVLHCFAQSGNAYKVALYLECAGLDWQPKFVDFFKGETRTQQFRESVSEIGEVPVLTHAGRNYAQSGAILTWLAEKTGHFAPNGEDERHETLKWLLFDNHKFTSYMATLRFLLGIARTGQTPVTEFLQARVKAATAIADRHLADRPFMLGGRPTIADFSMAGYIYYPEPNGVEWETLPHLSAWRDRMRALPRWKHPHDLMPGHPLPV